MRRHKRTHTKKWIDPESAESIAALSRPSGLDLLLAIYQGRRSASALAVIFRARGALKVRFSLTEFPSPRLERFGRLS